MMKQATILISGLILLLISGCSTTPSNDTKTGEKFTALRQSELTILQDQMHHADSFSSAQSIDDYQIRAEIGLDQENNDLRIVYNVIVDHPKVAMDDVVVSFLLEDKMNVKLITNDVFFTNLNGDVKTLSDLSPDGELKGTTAFRAFIIDPKAIDQEFLNLYQRIYVHIVWNNSEGVKESQFIAVTGETSKELVDFLTESMKPHAIAPSPAVKSAL
ncbi:hypothetical protein [Paenibacillus glufosinatiresistens]|uniref:hypothetical protein n=1 Tax=Paenibacillus glufosinatiresistens TaxID=3070657 RepID=UPI00286D90E8|nr:hypothetical protein [Paenibacillus sp. YX.27]